MSLINEALKKAQRLRAEQRPDYTTPPMPGAVPASRIPKRKQAMPAQTLVVIVGAAAGLIVISAVLTAYLINRSPEPAATHKATAIKNTAAAGASAPSPVIIAPVLLIEKPAAEPAPKPPAPAGESASSPGKTIPTEPAAPISKTPAPSLAQETPAHAASSPVVESAKVEEIRPRETLQRQPPPVVSPARTPASARPDPRIQIFVDSVRVAGIRYSGSDSKVLMNDRVYRVNDVVERLLDVRLQNVAPDSLTFVDANGITYVKNF